jgi:hypothetical protein
MFLRESLPFSLRRFPGFEVEGDFLVTTVTLRKTLFPMLSGFFYAEPSFIYGFSKFFGRVAPSGIDFIIRVLGGWK